MALNSSTLNTQALNAVTVNEGLTTVFTAHDVYYKSWNNGYQSHEVEWCSIAVGIHQISWSSTFIYNLHTVSYRFSAPCSHSVSWSSQELISVANSQTVIYQSENERATVSTSHEVMWLSENERTTVSTSHEVMWLSEAERTVVSASHVISYMGNNLSLSFAAHEVNYQSNNSYISAITSHLVLWSSMLTVQQTHETNYKSIINVFNAHYSTWASEDTLPAFNTHVVRYHSLTTAPIIQDGLVYVRV